MQQNEDKNESHKDYHLIYEEALASINKHQLNLFTNNMFEWACISQSMLKGKRLIEKLNLFLDCLHDQSPNQNTSQIQEMQSQNENENQNQNEPMQSENHKQNKKKRLPQILKQRCLYQYVLKKKENKKVDRLSHVILSLIYHDWHMDQNCYCNENIMISDSTGRDYPDLLEIADETMNSPDLNKTLDKKLKQWKENNYNHTTVVTSFQQFMV